VKTRIPLATDSFKHLTLTVPSEDDLTFMVARLVRAFRRLRQRHLWRKHVRGGAFVVEITRGESGWHAHIHAIIESSFIPWTSLQLEWLLVSGGTGCYIKRIPASSIVKYLTKYITKSELSPEDRLIASSCLKGSRLYQPFGAWHGIINDIGVPRPVCSKCGQSDWYFGDSVAAIFAHCRDPVDIINRVDTPIIHAYANQLNLNLVSF